MQVRPATDSDLEVIARWLTEPEIAQWLDQRFGRGVDARALKLAVARGTERLFVFTPDGHAVPIGVVGLSNIHPRFRTAMLWYALGERQHGGQGLTTRAVAAVLDIGLRALELEAINAWAAVGNEPSIRILEKNGFRFVGRQRRCHRLGDEVRDRLLYDIVTTDLAGMG